MKLIKMVWAWLKRLNAPMPMNNFGDYEGYWQVRGFSCHLLERWKFTVEALPSSGTLLDVGCGEGNFLRHLKEMKPHFTAAGVDISMTAVSRARAAGFAAEKLDPSQQQLPGVYDYVTCFEVLEHVAEAEVLLEKMKRAFRKQLFISIPNIGHFSCRLRLMIFGRAPQPRVLLHAKEHLRHWGVRDFHEWADHHGLKVVKSVGDWGTPLTPWKLFPGVFAAGMIYVLEHTAESGDPPDASTQAAQA